MCPDYGTRRYIVGMFNRRRHAMKKQTIRIENRIPFAELGKAIGTTDKEYKAHMGTGFAVKDPVNPKRKHEIRRADFEDTMCSMQCWFLSDEAMQKIADRISDELKFYDFSYSGENYADELDDALCKEEEEALRAFGVLYYEGEIPDISHKGARLFSVDFGYGTFNRMVNDENGRKVEMTTDDGKVVTTWLGLVVEEY